MSFKAVRSDTTLIAEVAATTLLVIGVIAVANSGDLSVAGADVHPLWIPVLVFAARYGVRGLFVSVATSALALAIVSVAEYGTIDQVSSRASNPHDLIALVAATLVAWMAMMRDARLAAISEERDDITRRLRDSEENVGAMHEVVRVLRDRLDRIDLSITMWRAIARRIDHGPTADAAAAALELAAIRTGAGAGFIQRGTGVRLQTVATYGHVPSGASDISRDGTVLDAVTHRRPAMRNEAAPDDDSQVAVPIIDPMTGTLLGVLAMRDVPHGRLRGAEIRDLEIVAAWLAEAFPRQQVRARDGAC